MGPLVSVDPTSTESGYVSKLYVVPKGKGGRRQYCYTIVSTSEPRIVGVDMASPGEPATGVFTVGGNAIRYWPVDATARTRLPLEFDLQTADLDEDDVVQVLNLPRVTVAVGRQWILLLRGAAWQTGTATRVPPGWEAYGACMDQAKTTVHVVMHNPTTFGLGVLDVDVNGSGCPSTVRNAQQACLAPIMSLLTTPFECFTIVQDQDRTQPQNIIMRLANDGGAWEVAVLPPLFGPVHELVAVSGVDNGTIGLVFDVEGQAVQLAVAGGECSSPAPAPAVKPEPSSDESTISVATHAALARGWVEDLQRLRALAAQKTVASEPSERYKDSASINAIVEACAEVHLARITELEVALEAMAARRKAEIINLATSQQASNATVQGMRADAATLTASLLQAEEERDGLRRTAAKLKGADKRAARAQQELDDCRRKLRACEDAAVEHRQHEAAYQAQLEAHEARAAQAEVAGRALEETVQRCHAEAAAVRVRLDATHERVQQLEAVAAQASCALPTPAEDQREAARLRTKLGALEQERAERMACAETEAVTCERLKLQHVLDKAAEREGLSQQVREAATAAACKEQEAQQAAAERDQARRECAVLEQQLADAKEALASQREQEAQRAVADRDQTRRECAALEQQLADVKTAMAIQQATSENQADEARRAPPEEPTWPLVDALVEADPWARAGSAFARAFASAKREEDALKAAAEDREQDREQLVGQVQALEEAAVAREKALVDLQALVDATREPAVPAAATLPNAAVREVTGALPPSAAPALDEQDPLPRQPERPEGPSRALPPGAAMAPFSDAATLAEELRHLKRQNAALRFRDQSAAQVAESTAHVQVLRRTIDQLTESMAFLTQVLGSCTVQDLMQAHWKAGDPDAVEAVLGRLWSVAEREACALAAPKLGGRLRAFVKVTRAGRGCELNGEGASECAQRSARGAHGCAAAGRASRRGHVPPHARSQPDYQRQLRARRHGAACRV